MFRGLGRRVESWGLGSRGLQVLECLWAAALTRRILLPIGSLVVPFWEYLKGF